MPIHRDGTAAERLALEVFVKLRRCADSITARLNSQLTRENLTESQFGVLEAVFHLGPLCQADLAKKILKSSGNITMVVANLEKRGLIARARRGSDRRFADVILTEEGRSLIIRIFPSHLSRVVEAFSMLSAEEQSQLANLCRIAGTQQRAIGKEG